MNRLSFWIFYAKYEKTNLLYLLTDVGVTEYCSETKISDSFEWSLFGTCFIIPQTEAILMSSMLIRLNKCCLKFLTMAIPVFSFSSRSWIKAQWIISHTNTVFILQGYLEPILELLFGVVVIIYVYIRVMNMNTRAMQMSCAVTQ